MPPRKGWDALAPKGRTRTGSEAYARAHPELGLTGREIYQDDRLRRIATGHGETPRSPLAALRDPLRYQDYSERRQARLRALAQTTEGRAATERGFAAQRQADETATPVGFGPMPGGSPRREGQTLGEAQRYAQSMPTLLAGGWLQIVRTPDGWMVYVLY